MPVPFLKAVLFYSRAILPVELVIPPPLLPSPLSPNHRRAIQSVLRTPKPPLLLTIGEDARRAANTV
jgi:hypothetical protein